MLTHIHHNNSYRLLSPNTLLLTENHNLSQAPGKILRGPETLKISVPRAKNTHLPPPPPNKLLKVQTALDLASPLAQR